jgi:hypothetical protein
MERNLLVLTAVLVAGCQFLLPDIQVVDGDGGTDADSDADSDTDADTDTDTDPGGTGDPCEEDDDCQSDNCDNDVCCADGSTCCTGDEHCVLGGQHLACDTSAFACFEECGPESVDHDDRCADGHHCDANMCFEDIVVGACDEHSDCASAECVTGWCCEHAGLCCAKSEDCPDLFSGCATDNTRTCVYTSVPHPDTGQATCYDVDNQPIACSSILPGHDYHGQDGHYPGPARVYNDLGDGRIHDTVTGLIWVQSVAAQMNWASANDHCNALTLASATWRLPKRYQLQALVDYSSTATSGLDGLFDVPGGTTFLWTGTALAGAESSTAWVVNVADGAVQREGKTSTQPRVLCVAE